MDYTVIGQPGDTVFIVTPLNDQARQNLEENVGGEAQWWGGGVAVEHRYITPLVMQLREEGWEVE